MPWEPPHTLRSKLREHKALDYLEVRTDDEDEPQRVNVPSHRNRAQKVLRVLSEISWTVIEFFDKKGGLLGRHVRGAEDEPPPGEVETLQPSTRTAEASTLLNIMLRAQEMVLSRFQGMLQPLLDNTYKLVDTSMRRLDLQERQYQYAQRENAKMHDSVVAAQMQLVRAAANVASSDDDDEGMAGDVLTSMMPAFVRAALSKDDNAGDDKGRAQRRTRPGKRKPSERADRPTKERPAPNGASAPHSE